MPKDVSYGKKYIIGLLSFHFLVALLLYLNTTTFREISESGSVLNAYFSLLRGDKVPLFMSYWFFFPAFIAYFLKLVFGGTLLYYFVFQCLLSTLTVYLMYKVVLYVSKSLKAALLASFLIIIYTEYVLLASVFYNQIYEIFFISMFLFVLFRFQDESDKKKITALAALLLSVIYFSMYFRKSLIFVYLVFIALMLLNFKDRKYILKLSAVAVPAFILLFFFNPYKMYNSAYIDNTEALFWGHTLYGGHGGEAAFLFPENKDRFDQRLNEFMASNHYEKATREVMDKFETEEIINFVKSEPHKWILLQFKKVFFTFGVVPERDGLIMLIKGKLKMHWIVAALLLQLPYSFILLLFILCLDLSYKGIRGNRYKQVLYILGLYLISGICLFGPYQERYRPVVFVCIFIPVIALNFPRLKTIFRRENRRELFAKIFMLLVLLSVWMYQVYEVFFVYQDRYFKAIQ